MKKGNFLKDHLFCVIGAVCMLVAIIGSFLTFRTAPAGFVNPFTGEQVAAPTLNVNLFDSYLNEIVVIAVIFMLFAIGAIVFFLRRETGISTMLAIGAAIIAVVLQIMLGNTKVSGFTGVAKNDPSNPTTISLEEATSFKETIEEGDVVQLTYSFYDAEGNRQGGANKAFKLTIGSGDFPELEANLTGKSFGGKEDENVTTFEYTVPDTVDESMQKDLKKIVQKNPGLKGTISCKPTKVEFSGDQIEVKYTVYLQAKDPDNSSNTVQDGKTGIGAILMMVGAVLAAISSIVALNKNE